MAVCPCAGAARTIRYGDSLRVTWAITVPTSREGAPFARAQHRAGGRRSPALCAASTTQQLWNNAKEMHKDEITAPDRDGT